MNLSAAIRHFAERKTIKPKTRANYLQVAARLERGLPNKPITELSARDLNQYQHARHIAGVSLFLWIGVVVCGRLIPRVL